MKKILSFAALIAAVLLLVACPQEVDTDTGGGEVVDSNPEIIWVNSAFGVAARAELGKSDGASVMPSEAATITNLNLSGKTITKLDDLNHFTGLTTLNLNNTKITLAAKAPTAPTLERLTTLILSNNEIEDIRTLSTLAPQLTSLDLRYNKITNINALATLNTEATLDLRDNSMSTSGTDWVPVKNVTNVLGKPEVIGWRDDVIEAAARKKLTPPKLEGDIYTTEVTGITDLVISGEKITVLDDIKYFTGLTSLTLINTQITDITALAGLLKLTTLDLSGNRIANWTPVDHVDNVTGRPVIVWKDDKIEAAVRDKLQKTSGDIMETEVVGITDLSLAHKNISNIADIAHLTGLTSLMLNGNEIVDITPLQHLTKLTTLDLSHNDPDITDITPLQYLTKLTTLTLTGNHIADLTPLQGCIELTTLYLNYNKVTDLTPLQNLTKLTTLDLSSNSDIANWTPVAHVGTVTGRPEKIVWTGESTPFEDAVRAALTPPRPTGVILKDEVSAIENLDLTNKNISNIADIVHFTGLTNLVLTSNSITDLTPLKSLTKLTTLNLTDNTNTLNWTWENWLPVDHVVTVTGRPEHIVWTDSAFKAAVRTALNRPTGLIFKSVASTTNSLDLSGKKISDIADIVYFTGLTTLDLRGNPSITDWTPLDRLTIATLRGRPTEPTLNNITYEIDTPEKLLWIATATAAQENNNFTGKTVKFTGAEIDMAKQAFSGIPIFAGTLEGKDANRTIIKNLTIDSEKDNVGLINQLNAGTIQNLTIDSTSRIQGVKVVGSFVGIAKAGSTLKNLRNEAAVTGSGSGFGKNVGGIIGTATNATITNVSNSGVVTAEAGRSMEVGGIIAVTEKCTIDFAENHGMVTVEGNYASTVGGIVGDANGTLGTEECIQKVMNFGNITATGTDTLVGGIIGNGSSIQIIDAANVGIITGSQKNTTSSNSAGTGGILGKNVNVDMTRVYNYGDYSGSWAGSIAGLLSTNITTVDVVVKGKSTKPYGGWIDFGVTEVYPSTAYYLTEADFKDMDIFAGKNWTNWKVKSGDDYPTLIPFAP